MQREPRETHVHNHTHKNKYIYIQYLKNQKKQKKKKQPKQNLFLYILSVILFSKLWFKIKTKEGKEKIKLEMYSDWIG